MQRFVARQPIFDGRGELFAYELLFRPGGENAFGDGDLEEASRSVIEESLSPEGFDALTGGRRAFVNVTRHVLVERLYRQLPPGRTVLELLETIVADDEVLAACRVAREEGYLIALDDFVLSDDTWPLVEHADFVKLDFLQTTPDVRAEWLEKLAPSAVRLLAEKVETREQVDEARAQGFSYFQGFYFQKPEMVRARVLPPFKLHALRVLGELGEKRFDFDRLERLVRQEPQLARRLLDDLNGAAGPHPVITSVRQAESVLGEQHFRRWAALVAIAGLGEDRPRELTVTSLVRGRFCELLSQRAQVGDEAMMFLAGLVSGADVLVGLPMSRLVEDVPLSDELAHVVLGDGSLEASVLDLARHYELARWPEMAATAERLGLPEERVPGAFRQALEYARRFF